MAEHAAAHFTSHGEHKLAADHHNKAAKYHMSLDDLDGVAKNHERAAESYKNLGDSKAAALHLSHAAHSHTCSGKYALAASLHSQVADMHKQAGDLEMAVLAQTKAAHSFTHSGDHDNAAHHHSMLAKYHREAGNVDAARLHSERAARAYVSAGRESEAAALRAAAQGKDGVDAKHPFDTKAGMHATATASLKEHHGPKRYVRAGIEFREVVLEERLVDPYRLGYVDEEEGGGGGRGGEGEQQQRAAKASSDGGEDGKGRSCSTKKVRLSEDIGPDGEFVWIDVDTGLIFRKIKSWRARGVLFGIAGACDS